MKVVIGIHKDFEGDYIADKFKDFFSRVIADIDCKGMCGRYEKEIAEMFLKAFEESEEKMKCDECKNANICLDHREEETLVGCTSGIPDRKVHTNADRIRNMSDEELANMRNALYPQGKGYSKEEVQAEVMCYEALRRMEEENE